MAQNPALSIRPVRDEAELGSVIDELLIPSFPPAELGSRDALREAWRAGEMDVVVAVVDERLAGAAIATWPSDPHEVILLTWLVVGQAGRGRGTGGKLVRSALARWQERFDPLLIVGEVEDPRFHAGSEATGDPAARWRFYERLGARLIELPFVMPRVVGEDRVDHMLLIALSGRALDDDGAPSAPASKQSEAPGAAVHELSEAPGAAVHELSEEPEAADERSAMPAKDASTADYGTALERFLRAYVADSGEERTNGRYADDIEEMLVRASRARVRATPHLSTS